MGHHSVAIFLKYIPIDGSIYVFGSWNNWENGVAMIRSTVYEDYMGVIRLDSDIETLEFKFKLVKPDGSIEWILSSEYETTTTKEGYVNNIGEVVEDVVI
jgi:hypothetical protein